MVFACCPEKYLLLEAKSMSASSGSGVSYNPSGSNAVSFHEFFEAWLVRQEDLMNQLLAVQRSSSTDENFARDLIARVLEHYQEYFAEKSRMANANVFSAFSPAWFTPLERSFLWIAGFKPRLVTRLAMKSVDDLTGDQIRRIETLTMETRRQEKAINEDMARIQESVGGPPVVDLARRQSGHRPIEWLVDKVVYEIQCLRAAMVNTLSDADGLRMRTAEQMVGILSPIQNVKLFAAAAQLQFKIRMMGFQWEAARRLEGGEAGDDPNKGW